MDLKGRDHYIYKIINQIKMYEVNNVVGFIINILNWIQQDK